MCGIVGGLLASPLDKRALDRALQVADGSA
jgi:hypothetical protein